MDKWPYIYVMIGGRNKWLEFVNAVPAAWTLFGVWITWSKMFAVLSAFFTFVVTVAVTQLVVEKRFSHGAVGVFPGAP